jgi:argininosuccinate lyase
VAEKKGCDVSELSYEELKEVDSRIKPEVSELLTLSSSMNARNSQGGTSSKRTKEQLDFVKNWLSEN